MSKNRIYVAIDLKSFYASVECKERNLDPLTTNLVVADARRTEKTICLAVSPSLKQYGISGRARLFEVIQKVKEVNRERIKHTSNYKFVDRSIKDNLLKNNPDLQVSFIAAPPRMALYMDYSTRIYNIYLKYVSEQDIHVYSIDEVFIDVTTYLKTYNMSPKELAMKIILDIYQETNITATAGIGTNLYLSKIAMDIVAKHIKPNEYGVRIAQLDETRYRKYLWDHQPITDFWRVGKGYQRRLKELELYTMGDIARCSLNNEEILYKTFGVNAELLIDHAWGYESCTMADIKTYKPDHSSIGTGQVLSQPYDYQKARLIVKEMLDLLALDLVDKGLVTNKIVLTVGYDIENINDDFEGNIVEDFYGRKIPKQAHGTANIDVYTSSSKLIIQAVMKLYDRIINKKLSIRRINISAANVEDESILDQDFYEQLDIFSDVDKLSKQREKEKESLEKEKQIQKATLKIKKKYGKNKVLKGMNYQEGAKTIERNGTIGGHKA